jgi:hypothetical protein
MSFTHQVFCCNIDPSLQLVMVMYKGEMERCIIIGFNIVVWII